MIETLLLIIGSILFVATIFMPLLIWIVVFCIDGRSEANQEVIKYAKWQFTLLLSIVLIIPSINFIKHRWNQ